MDGRFRLAVPEEKAMKCLKSQHIILGVCVSALVLVSTHADAGRCQDVVAATADRLHITLGPPEADLTRLSWFPDASSRNPVDHGTTGHAELRPSDSVRPDSPPPAAATPRREGMKIAIDARDISFISFMLNDAYALGEAGKERDCFVGLRMALTLLHAVGDGELGPDRPSRSD